MVNNSTSIERKIWFTGSFAEKKNTLRRNVYLLSKLTRFFCPVHFLSLFPKSPGFSFAMWFGYAFPQMVVLLFVAWIWIQLLFLKFK